MFVNKIIEFYLYTQNKVAIVVVQHVKIQC